MKKLVKWQSDHSENPFAGHMWSVWPLCDFIRFWRIERKKKWSFFGMTTLWFDKIINFSFEMYQSFGFKKCGLLPAFLTYFFANFALLDCEFSFGLISFIEKCITVVRNLVVLYGTDLFFGFTLLQCKKVKQKLQFSNSTHNIAELSMEIKSQQGENLAT